MHTHSITLRGTVIDYDITDSNIYSVQCAVCNMHLQYAITSVYSADHHSSQWNAEILPSREGYISQHTP